MPLIAASLLGLHHDLYLLVYFTVVGTFLASFVAHTHLDWREWLRTRLWWSLGIGAVVAFAMVRNVMNEASMAHPSGGFFWFELLWRGLLYGTVDALMLFVFPATVAYLLLRDSDRRRRLRFAGLTLLLTMGITATYHLGYPQFRGSDLVQPEIGAVIATIPTALTGNPVGAIVVHDVFHVGGQRPHLPQCHLPAARPRRLRRTRQRHRRTGIGRAVGRSRRHGHLRRASSPVPGQRAVIEMATPTTPSSHHGRGRCSAFAARRDGSRWRCSGCRCGCIAAAGAGCWAARFSCSSTSVARPVSRTTWWR